MTPRQPTRSRLFAPALLTLAAVLGACNIVGPAGYFLLGPEKIPAMYELDPDRPTVVFIDDRASKVPARTARTTIGKVAERALLDEKVVKEVISSEGLAAVVSRERFGQPMGIAEIGEAVGAKTVIYATIDEFTISTDGTTFAPRAVLRVKVVDTETKQRLWPREDPGWYAMTVQVPERQGLAPRTAAEIQEAQQLLATRVGTALAKLFYKHEAHVPSERIGR